MDSELVRDIAFQSEGREAVARACAEQLIQRARTGKLDVLPSDETRSYRFLYLAGAPGIGKTRTLVQLPEMLQVELQRLQADSCAAVQALRDMPIVRIDITFNCATSVSDADLRDMEVALAARVLFDAIAGDTAEPPSFGNLLRDLLSRPLTVNDALSVWFTVRMPNPPPRVIAVLCVDEITKIENSKRVRARRRGHYACLTRSAAKLKRVISAVTRALLSPVQHLRDRDSRLVLLPVLAGTHVGAIGRVVSFSGSEAVHVPIPLLRSAAAWEMVTGALAARVGTISVDAARALDHVVALSGGHPRFLEHLIRCAPAVLRQKSPVPHDLWVTVKQSYDKCSGGVSTVSDPQVFVIALLSLNTCGVPYLQDEIDKVQSLGTIAQASQSTPLSHKRRPAPALRTVVDAATPQPAAAGAAGPGACGRCAERTV
jgi:hypothetical protein